MQQWTTKLVHVLSQEMGQTRQGQRAMLLLCPTETSLWFLSFWFHFNPCLQKFGLRLRQWTILVPHPSHLGSHLNYLEFLFKTVNKNTSKSNQKKRHIGIAFHREVFQHSKNVYKCKVPQALNQKLLIFILNIIPTILVWFLSPTEF